MLIIENNYLTRRDGVVLKRTYSDLGRYIMNEEGVCYTEAIDISSSPHTYTETDYPYDEYIWLDGEFIKNEPPSSQEEL